MPTYTNVHRIDPISAAAVTNDPYTRGESDISVSQLIQPQFAIGALTATEA